jgi:hypothetical protein
MLLREIRLTRVPQFEFTALTGQFLEEDQIRHHTCGQASGYLASPDFRVPSASCANTS